MQQMAQSEEILLPVHLMYHKRLKINGQKDLVGGVRKNQGEVRGESHCTAHYDLRSLAQLKIYTTQVLS